MNFDQSYCSHIAAKLEATQAYMAGAQWGGLVIASGALEPIFKDDYHHPFVVNPYFKEWLPLTGVPNCYLYIPVSGRPSLYFYKPQDIWHKVSALPDEFWSRHFDILEYGDEALLTKLLATIKGRTAFIGPAAALPSVPAAADWQLNDAGLLNYFNYRRACKSAYEVDSIEAANQRAAIAHKAAAEAFHTGASEYEINRAYLAAVNLREAELPYGNIIALNENGAILHYTHMDTEAPSPSRSFLIDAGFSVNGYAADISRSYCRDNSDSGALFSHLIAQLDKAQQQLIGQLQVGQEYLQAHLAMHRMLGDILYAAGLIKVDGESALAEGITSSFLPHGLGHLLGVQVHDLGGWQRNLAGQIQEPPAEHPYLRLNRPLADGMVITVEPGIYFIEPLLAQLKASTKSLLVDWQQVDRLRPFGGIRIEDNVLISERGARNLTRPYL
ncbi:MAG: Xaa-Pro dipeptidase [Cellvibrionaceae bacterium]|nr:Xaa-Pro dipeptidase [Cellvibrionaceae bacterium]